MERYLHNEKEGVHHHNNNDDHHHRRRHDYKSSDYDGCREIFVGGGWGGIYSFYRRVLNGAQELNHGNKNASDYCLMEQSSRIGGRTYSVSMNEERTGKVETEDFVIDVGAYRFSPDMHLVGDLILYQLQLPTECYEPACNSASDDFPKPFLFNYTAPLRRIVNPTTGLPSGYATALNAMVETCQALGARVFLNTQLVQVKVDKEQSGSSSPQQEHPSKVQLVFENTLTKVRTSVPRSIGSNATTATSAPIEVLVLNVPRNHLLEISGVEQAVDPAVYKTLECNVFDAPEDLFGPDLAHLVEDSKHAVTTLEKAYVYYDNAWWHTLLNETQGTWPREMGFAANHTSQNILIGIRWSDGPVLCNDNSTNQSLSFTSDSCRGFLEVYYSVSNETFYSTLPTAAAVTLDTPSSHHLHRNHYLNKRDLHHSSLTSHNNNDDDDDDDDDPLHMIWDSYGHEARFKLHQVHQAIMEVLEPLWQNQTKDIYKASRHLPPPSGMVVGVWQRPNHHHPLGMGVTAPTKVYYDPRLSGMPDQACGGIPGLTDESYRDTVLQPFDNPRSLTLATTKNVQEDNDDNDDDDNDNETATTPTLSSSPQIFLVNNDYVCTNVRYFWGDWAEESLMQAERAMYLLGTPKPAWIVNDTYYQQQVVEQVVQNHENGVPPETTAETAEENDFVTEAPQEQQQPSLLLVLRGSFVAAGPEHGVGGWYGHANSSPTSTTSNGSSRQFALTAAAPTASAAALVMVIMMMSLAFWFQTKFYPRSSLLATAATRHKKSYFKKNLPGGTNTHLVVNRPNDYNTLTDN